ncbi:MAG: PP2C family protein-serine/threonine phosphatase, partial [Myxococcaceae bacterium]
GDWWLRAAMDDARVVIGLGDVTGHGLSTALVATSATSGLAAALKMRDPRAVDAGLLMASLNQTLHLVGRGEYQMSAAIALFHVDANELEYSSGAHPAPVVYNRQEQKLGTLTVRGALLGASPATKFNSVRAPLYPGDVYVWYSDGLTEAQNSQNQIYGLKRLAAVVQRNGHLPAESLRDAIVADVRQHTGNIPQNDDITLIVAEYEPPN